MCFMSQNTYVKFYYIVLISNSLNSHVSYVQFHLSVLDIDLAILEEKSATITNASSIEEITHYKAWERSNKLNLMFMRMTVVDNIKTTIPKTRNAKEFMELVEERSQIVDKSLVGTLMSTLTTIKFDGSCTMHEHVIEMTNITPRFKTLEMTVNGNFLIQFILNSLSFEYGPFQMSYNRQMECT